MKAEIAYIHSMGKFYYPNPHLNMLRERRKESTKTREMALELERVMEMEERARQKGNHMGISHIIPL